MNLSQKVRGKFGRGRMYTRFGVRVPALLQGLVAARGYILHPSVFASCVDYFGTDGSPLVGLRPF